MSSTNALGNLITLIIALVIIHHGFIRIVGEKSLAGKVYLWLVATFITKPLKALGQRSKRLAKNALRFCGRKLKSGIRQLWTRLTA